MANSQQMKRSRLLARLRHTRDALLLELETVDTLTPAEEQALVTSITALDTLLQPERA